MRERKLQKMHTKKCHRRFVGILLQPSSGVEEWRQQIPLRSWYVSTTFLGITSNKNLVLLVTLTALRIINLTKEDVHGTIKG